MKKALLVVLFIVSILIAHTQQPPPKNPKDPDTDMIPEPPRDTTSTNGIYKVVEHEPEFPDGFSAFYKFLAKNIKYPKTAGDTYGKVFLQFIVEKNGSLSHNHVIRSLRAEFDNEALRVMKLSPKWKPGIQNGKHVRVLYNLPINFSPQ